MIAGTVHSQNKISGTVLSAEDSTAIIGASIYFDGTSIGVSSNQDGDFDISFMDNNSALIITSLGYEALVLDASEIPPTFSAPTEYFNGIIAGGDNALRNSIEGAEDQTKNAINDLKSYSINKSDTIIGISCSGAASYVISALEYARELNAKTIYLITNPDPFKNTKVDVMIQANTGPEIITGSTRMKAGTATKLILNMISTTTMIKLGKVYGNLMIDLKTVNKKLIDRGTRIISEITGLDYDRAKDRLVSAENSVKSAIVMEEFKCNLEEAKVMLENVDGFLHRLVEKK